MRLPNRAARVCGVYLVTIEAPSTNSRARAESVSPAAVLSCRPACRHWPSPRALASPPRHPRRRLSLQDLTHVSHRVPLEVRAITITTVVHRDGRISVLTTPCISPCGGAPARSFHFAEATPASRVRLRPSSISVSFIVALRHSLAAKLDLDVAPLHDYEETRRL